MNNLKENPIVCHIVCRNSKAHAELEKLCNRYGNDMYIDWEQSQISYHYEMKSKSDELAHYGETPKKNKNNTGDNQCHET